MIYMDRWAWVQFHSLDNWCSWPCPLVCRCLVLFFTGFAICVPSCSVCIWVCVRSHCLLSYLASIKLEIWHPASPLSVKAKCLRQARVFFPPPFFLDRYFPPPSERPFVLYIIGFSLQVISTTHSAVIAQMKITWIPKVAATCCAVAVSSFCRFCCGGGEGFFFLSRFFFKVFKSDKKQNLLAKQKRKFPPDKGTKIFSPSDSM